MREHRERLALLNKVEILEAEVERLQAVLAEAKAELAAANERAEPAWRALQAWNLSVSDTGCQACAVLDSVIPDNLREALRSTPREALRPGTSIECIGRHDGLGCGPECAPPQEPKPLPLDHEYNGHCDDGSYSEVCCFEVIDGKFCREPLPAHQPGKDRER